MRLLVSGCTRTVSRLAPLYPTKLGRLTSPAAGNNLFGRDASAIPWAADNGCFRGLNVPHFRRMLTRIRGPGCLFLVVPDCVGDHPITLALWSAWRDECAATGHPLAFVGQDGCTSPSVPWDECQAYFVGGTDGWRFSPTSRQVVREAKERGKHVHFGRVNSLVRLTLAWDWGCNSVDGTGLSWWGNTNLPRWLKWLETLEQQQTLPGWRD